MCKDIQLIVESHADFFMMEEKRPNGRRILLIDGQEFDLDWQPFPYGDEALNRAKVIVRENCPDADLDALRFVHRDPKPQPEKQP